MNTLKLVLLTTALLMTHFAFAQPGQGRDRGKMQKNKLAEELNLSEEQKAQLKEIDAAFKAEVKEISGNENLSKEAKIETMEKALAERKAKSDAVYTEEQKTQMESIKLEQKAQKIVRRGEQTKQMKAQREAMKEYYDENMKAELERMRKEFDTKLASEDKELIANWRIEAEKSKAMREEHKESRKKGEKAKSERKGEKEKEYREKRGDKGEGRSEMHDLLKKYEDDLNSIREANAPLFEKWEADQKGIAEQYKPEDAPDKANKMRQRDRSDRYKRAHKADHLGIRFLLMDF